jgi:hypothetical protein
MGGGFPSLVVVGQAYSGRARHAPPHRGPSGDTFTRGRAAILLHLESAFRSDDWTLRMSHHFVQDRRFRQLAPRVTPSGTQNLGIGLRLSFIVVSSFPPGSNATPTMRNRLIFSTRRSFQFPATTAAMTDHIPRRATLCLHEKSATPAINRVAAEVMS